jgi:hypothetical protein
LKLFLDYKSFISGLLNFNESFCFISWSFILTGAGFGLIVFSILTRVYFYCWYHAKICDDLSADNYGEFAEGFKLYLLGKIEVGLFLIAHIDEEPYVNIQDITVHSYLEVKHPNLMAAYRMTPLPASARRQSLLVPLDDEGFYDADEINVSPTGSTLNLLPEAIRDKYITKFDTYQGELLQAGVIYFLLALLIYLVTV